MTVSKMTVYEMTLVRIIANDMTVN
jgi:hypothetical protein